MGQGIGDLFIRVAGDLAPLKNDLDSVPRMLLQLDDKLASSLAGKARAKAKGSGFATDLLKGALSTAAGFVGGHALMDGLRLPPDIIQDSVKLAATWEKSSVQLGVLTGSADLAAGAMKSLQDFGVESGMGMSTALAEAKKLLAAGIELDQIVPTMRVLSDLTMGDKELFGRASLAYGQAKSAGVLQGDELRQLNELGIPVMDAVGKATGMRTDEVKKAVSEGKIQFRDLQKAFADLTGEGGKFFGMTAKGADTLDGQFARLGDAVEDLKREFGRAVIEEVGLKQATQDGARFATEMKAFVNDLRPAIRFVGDMGKGLAQVGGELLRNAPLFVGAVADSLRAASPQVAKLVDDVERFVNGLKDFKMDPRATIRAGIDIGRGLGEALEAVLKSLGDGLRGIFDEYIKPALQSLKEAADFWKGVKGIKDQAADVPGDIGRQLGQNWEKWQGKKPTGDEYLAERRKDFAPVERAAMEAETKVLTLKDRMDGPLKGMPRDEFERLKGDVTVKRKALMMTLDEIAGSEYGRKWTAKQEDVRIYDDVLAGLEKKLGRQAKELAAAAERVGAPMSGFKVNGQEVVPNGPAPKGPQTSKNDFWDGLEKRLMGWADARQSPADPKDALQALTGGLGGIDPKKMRSEYKLDPLLPPKLADPKFVPLQLPTAAEYGSRETADIWARSNAVPNRDKPELTEAQKQTRLLEQIEQNGRNEKGPKVADMNLR